MSHHPLRPFEIPPPSLRQALWTTVCFLVLLTLATGAFSASPPGAPSAQAKAGISGPAPRVLHDKNSFSATRDIQNAAYVVAKFHDDVDVTLRNNDLYQTDGTLLPGWRNVTRQFNAAEVRPLFAKNATALKRERVALSQGLGHALPNLSGYYRIDTPPRNLSQLLSQLNGLADVEIAYAMPQCEPAGDIAPPTPNYQTSQTYLNPAPAGVDALTAHTYAGGDGAGIRIIDIEIGWNVTHEDLDAAANAFVIIGNSTSFDDHGTAVLGEMVGGDNGYGVTGICPSAQVGMIGVSAMSAAEAALEATNHLSPGDIVLIELHAPGPRYNFQSRTDQLGYVCMEYFPAEYDAFQYLWARGIVVVEAAGNGAENYDDPLYGDLFDTTYRNSHAIIVGAGGPSGAASDLSRLSFSCYGERVNLQGYGSGVYTTGYGALFNGGGDKNQRYTATFSGTSSASPIVAGSAACLQGRYNALYGAALTADDIRRILNNTGTPQTGVVSQHIGPRPNLTAAFATLTAPPSLYSDPIYLGTTLPSGVTVYRSVTLHNRGSTVSVDFSLTAADTLPTLTAVDWLYASPTNGTIVANDSTTLTVTLDAALLEDRIAPYSGLIDIAWGPSGGPLDSHTVIPVYVTVPCADSHYVFNNSDSAGGPTYAWIDITASGIEIPDGSFHSSASPLDDGTAGPINLQFAFPFFDSVYTKVWIGVNGAISFTDSSVSAGGFFSALSIPTQRFVSFLPVFWNDLTIDPAGGGHGNIYYRVMPDGRFVISWEKIGNFNAANDTLVSFQVILNKNGDILLQYRDVGITSLDATALIGAEGVACSNVPYVDLGAPASFVPKDEHAILFEYTGVVLEQAGDADGSGDISIADALHIIAYIFSGGPAPSPLAAGDPDCSADANISDVTFLIAYIFLDGPEPCYYQL